MLEVAAAAGSAVALAAYMRWRWAVLFTDGLKIATVLFLIYLVFADIRIH